MVHIPAQITRGDIRQTVSQKITLQPGQLVTGRAIKFFANQHAQIQIGNMSLFAQLDTALQANQTYLFQVVSGEQKPQLKKLATISNETPSTEIAKFLGINQSKETDAILREIVARNLSFTKHQLESIQSLLKQHGNSSSHRDIAFHMLEKGLPLTTDTFLSIRTNRSQSFSHLVGMLQEQLSKSNIPEMVDLRSQLSLYTKGTSEGRQSVLQAFLNKHQGVLAPVLEEITGSSMNQIRSIIQQPGNQEFITLKNRLLQQITLQLSGSKSELHSLQLLYNKLAGRAENQQPIPNGEWKVLEQHPLTQKLLLRADSELKQTFHQASGSDQQSVKSALNLIKATLDQQLPQETTKLLRLLVLQLEGMEHSQKLPITERFLQHVHQFTQSSGLTDENQLLQMTTRQEVLSLKQALMLHIPQVPDTVAQRMEQLVHWITGAQISNATVQDGAYLTHSFQIPGGSFGLEEDMTLEFQGKKKKDGELDPDYCRILFDLNLANIGETIITLGVQKRVVTITIFNNQEYEAQAFAHKWKSNLEQQLENLDYHLSAIHWKPLLNEKSNSIQPNGDTGHTEQQKGFDWRV